jgi:hypothetical protein
MSLCYKCRDYILNRYGTNAYFPPPHTHCHHPEPEEEPKEKCWCEEKHELMDWYNSAQREYEKYKYCPICGKKLED